MPGPEVSGPEVPRPESSPPGAADGLASLPGSAGRTPEQNDIAGLELRALFLAALAWLGADLAPAMALSRPVLFCSVALILVGTVQRRIGVLAPGVFCLLSFLGATADAAYEPMLPGPLESEATVVGDPKPVGLGWRVDLRLADGQRVEAVGYGLVGWDLSEMTVGQTYRLIGQARSPGERDWYRVRHISGLVSVDRIEPIAGPGLVWQGPELARDLVVAGGATMSERHRALYLGLVIGDDRFQPLGQQLNFRSAGLTHLLAVSGQNVAFVLAVARAPLGLLGRRSRLLVTVVVLLVFAVVTRMEPSVMRATAAALLAVWAAASGRQRSGVIILSLAVAGVLCLDPFLVDSVGFQLSVAASLGILLLGPAIEQRLPGPGWFGTPVATTLSAQIGVSPLLSAYFGPISVLSIPANLLAGWAAALVMTLGLTAGVVAGMLPDQLATVLQMPTVALLRWLDWVALLGGRTLAPRFGPVGLILLTVAALLANPQHREQVTTGSPERPKLVRAFALAMVVLMMASAWPSAPSEPVECGPGVTWYPGGSSLPGLTATAETAPLRGQSENRTVLVLGSASYGRAIEGCLDRGIRTADLVIAQRGSRGTGELVAAVRETMAIGQVVAPPQHSIVGATRLLQPATVFTGDIRLTVTPEGRDRLTVAADLIQPG